MKRQANMKTTLTKAKIYEIVTGSVVAKLIIRLLKIKKKKKFDRPEFRSLKTNVIR